MPTISKNHERLFGYLVDSWRRQFDSPGMPFLMWCSCRASTARRGLAFRDSQRRLASRIPGVGMAVSSDLGDSLDVHPRNKRPVGERPARIALHDVYSATSVVPSGPLPLSASTVPGGIAIEMEYADGMHPATGDSIIGFEVASSILGPYFPASATISGNRIILKIHARTPTPPPPATDGSPFTRANLGQRRTPPRINLPHSRRDSQPRRGY